MNKNTRFNITFVKESTDHESKGDCSQNVEQEKYEDDERLCVIEDLIVSAHVGG